MTKLNIRTARKIAREVKAGQYNNHPDLQSAFDRLSMDDIFSHDDAVLRRALWETDRVNLGE